MKEMKMAFIAQGFLRSGEHRAAAQSCLLSGQQSAQNHTSCKMLLNENLRWKSCLNHVLTQPTGSS